MTPKLNAVYLVVKDMQRAVSFYAALFDMPVSTFDLRMSEFKLENAFSLLLYDPSEDNLSVRFGDNVVLNFEVEDARVMFQHLAQQGHTVVVPLMQLEQDLFFQIQDTEGNVLEFYQSL